MFRQKRVLILIYVILFGSFFAFFIFQFTRYRPRIWTQEDWYKLSPKYLELDFPSKYLLNDEEACSESSKVLIIVTSRPNASETRQAIRSTWASTKSSRNGVVVKFLLGYFDDRVILEAVLGENDRYGDVIVDASFIDSYRNLTLKSIAMVKWAAKYCPEADALLKVDDDTWINIDRLLEVLPFLETGIHGHIFYNQGVNRDPQARWFMSEADYPFEKYPDYASGSSYLIVSKKTALFNLLFDTAKTITPIWLEDIHLTGLVAEKARVTRFNHDGFNYLKVSYDSLEDVCKFNQIISSHEMTNDDKYQLWQRLIASKDKCDVF